MTLELNLEALQAELDAAWIECCSSGDESEWINLISLKGLSIFSCNDYGYILTNGMAFTDPSRTPAEVNLSAPSAGSLQSSPSGIKRNLIGMMVFRSEDEFMDWQREAPREIFEVTPTITAAGSTVHKRIFVTYNAGVISSSKNDQPPKVISPPPPPRQIREGGK